MEAAVIIALIIFGLPIILSIVAMSKLGGLEKEIARLRSRVTLLEKGDEAVPAVERSPWVSQTTDDTKTSAAMDRQTSQSSSRNTSKAPAKKAQTANTLKSASSPRKFSTAKQLNPSTTQPKTPKKSLEELIGAQWSVWVGGLALLIGAVFLLRYSIEAGVFTPAMRIAMASILGMFLLGIGEWLHRADLTLKTRHTLSDLADGITRQAYIPTLLTAIGLFTLFGTAYAAYALYGFIGPVTVFVLLGLISLGSLMLSFRHGPVLAAVGLIGAMSVPLLVQTDTPNIYALYGYVGVIAAASLGVAYRKNWGWLNVATLFALLFWSAMTMRAGQSETQNVIWFTYLGIAFLVNAVISERTPDSAIPVKRPKTLTWAALTHESVNHNPIISALWTVIASVLVLAVASGARDSLDVFILSLSLCGVVMGIAWICRRQCVYSLIGAVTAFLILTDIGGGWRPALELIIVGGAFSLGLLAFALLRMKPIKSQGVASLSTGWAVAATLYPLIYLLTLYSLPGASNLVMFSVVFSILAGLFALTAFVLKGGQYEARINAGVYVIGSAVAYLAAGVLGVSGHGESLAIMAGIVIYALAAWRFNGLIPRMVVPVFALLSVLHTLAGPIEAGRIEETLILNSLWLYFALPCALSAGAAWALSRRKTDIWSEGMKAITLTFAALFISFQIHHFMNGGNILAYRLSFDELALHVLTGLSFTLGATRLAPHQWDAKGDLHSRVLPTVAIVVSSLTLLIFALGVCLVKSPLFHAEEIIRGNLILNSLTLGYCLPGLLLAYIAQRLKTRRPENYIRLLSELSLVAIILFITASIRFIYTGRVISIFEDFPTGFELYTISAAWLVLGIALLVIGLKRNRQDLRLASAVLIILTVLKTFLIDMAELEGVLRALSFVILGLILIVIGRRYQKLLFSKTLPTKPHAKDLPHETSC